MFLERIANWTYVGLKGLIVCGTTPMTPSLDVNNRILTRDELSQKMLS